MKNQLHIYLVNAILATFSWSRWTDIIVFTYGYNSYLLQGKVNKRTNAKVFQVISFKNKLGTASANLTMEKLDECGLVDTKVKYNQ